MGKYIEKLISISSNSFNQGQVNLATDFSAIAGNLGNDHALFLSKKNGFYAFESALRVFPSGASEFSFSIEEWNSEGLWRKEYAGLADGCLFFAEDIFGGQFCIKNNVIHSFDPETGGLEEVADSFEGWVEELLADYNVWTGYSLAEEWQKINGVLPNHQRLMPKTPFACGGQFELDNLMAIDVVSGMKARANLAKQIIDMPDGAQIEFNIIE